MRACRHLSLEITGHYRQPRSIGGAEFISLRCHECCRRMRVPAPALVRMPRLARRITNPHEWRPLLGEVSRGAAVVD